jgi:hypothetical protein
MNTLTPSEVAAARAAIEKLALATGHPEFEGAVVLISGLMDKLSCPDGPFAKSLPDLAQIRSVLRVITQLHARIRRGIELEGSSLLEMDSLCFDVARADRAAGRAARIACDDQTWSHIRTLCTPFVGAALFLGLLGWCLHSIIVGALAAVAVFPVVQIGWKVARFHWITRRKIPDRTRDLLLVTKRIQAENEQFLSTALDELRRELGNTLDSLETLSAKG